MGGLLSNIFHNNACVIRKNAFKVWQIFSFLYFSETNVNTKVPVADSIFICVHCSNSRIAYFCELVIIKVEATYYLQFFDIVPALHIVMSMLYFSFTYQNPNSWSLNQYGNGATHRHFSQHGLLLAWVNPGVVRRSRRSAAAATSLWTTPLLRRHS